MTQFSDINEAIGWIDGRRWKGEKNGLENTRALLEALGNPQNSMGRIVHVAGTNGKGSTCAFLAAALRECGYKIGLFTSPYLRRFNERIQFDGSPIPDADFTLVASEVREKAEALAEKGIFCTTFEMYTACACLYYARMKADYSVMEVGMGGRLDSTNVLPASVSVIAAIGMDHMAKLGNTPAEIAAEKAGIMKPGVPCAVMDQQPEVMEVFRRSALAAGAPLFITPEISVVRADERCSVFGRRGELQKITIAGRHQCANANLALTALECLGIDMAAARRGIENARWDGRLQWMGNVLIDCGHNPQGATALKEYCDEFLKGRHTVLLTGMMQDKQTEACAEIFETFADECVATAVDWPRAISPEELKQRYRIPAVAVTGIKNALAEARRRAGEDGVIVACGSVYLAGDVINILENE